MTYNPYIHSELRERERERLRESKRERERGSMSDFNFDSSSDEERDGTDVSPIARKRKKSTSEDALRVVLHEQDSKRMKKTREIEKEVSGVAC